MNLHLLKNLKLYVRLLMEFVQSITNKMLPNLTHKVDVAVVYICLLYTGLPKRRPSEVVAWLPFTNCCWWSAVNKAVSAVSVTRFLVHPVFFK